MPLLNLTNLPDGQISGLCESRIRNIRIKPALSKGTITDEFSKNIDEDSNVPNLTEEQLNILREIEESAVLKSTANQTKTICNQAENFFEPKLFTREL